MTVKRISHFICLFVFVEFIVPLENFHLYGDVTIAVEGLQILTYARHSWTLSSEGSLTCHAHCDTGLPFIMVISEDPWHSHLLPSVWQWSCHLPVFTTQVCRDRWSNPGLPHARRTLYLYATAFSMISTNLYRGVERPNEKNSSNGRISKS